MRRFIIVVALWGMLFGTVMDCSADDWRHFRGTDHSGVGEAELPAVFDDEHGVAWKAELPGTGPSCPIVVGELVIVTAATGPMQDRLHVIAFDKETGEKTWHRQFWATGHTAIHPFGGVAANTPTSDGKHVVATFSTNDVVCLDMDGNLLWYRGLAYDYPTLRNDVGMSSSPVIVGDTAIVQCENQGESFVAGLDLADGTTRWCIDRDKSAIWSSPTILTGEPGDKPLVLLVGRDGLSGVDPLTGRVVFTYETSCNTMASPTPHGRDIFLPANGIHHLRYDPVNETIDVLWYESRLRGSAPSPAVKGDRLYVQKSPSILTAVDIESGRTIWQERVKGKQFWASPVIAYSEEADGKIYVTSHDGLIQAFDLESGELLGTSEVEQGCLATPAIDDDAMYVRTNEYLRKVVGD